MTLGRGPLAVACVGLGAIGAVVVTSLYAQPIPIPAAAPLPGREWQSFAPVAKRVLPAVVCIEGKGRAKRQAGEDTDPGFGSGVLISADGVILTNNHVVADLDAVEITLASGRKIPSADIRRDPKTDLALIKLADAKELPFLEFGDSDQMEVGDRVLALGAPFGLTGSVTHGIVSAKSRNNLKLNAFEDFIQTDAAMNPGNSGGPLVNMDGKVVGLTSAIKTRTGGFQGVGLAVSSNLAKKIADDLLKNGSVKRSFVGLAARDLDADTAAKAGVKGTAGAVVTKVGEESPAAKAGLVVGDVITKVNGQPVKDAQDLIRVTSALPVGQVIDVLLWRDGKFYVGKVTVEEEKVALKPEPKPETLPAGVSSEMAGLAMTDFTEDMALQRKLPKETRGAAISGVARNSLAERSGLARGLVVLKVDKTVVTSALTFEQALKKATAEDGALLHVLKPTGDVDFVLLRLK